MMGFRNLAPYGMRPLGVRKLAPYEMRPLGFCKLVLTPNARWAFFQKKR